jgi:hypothetical protein
MTELDDILGDLGIKIGKKYAKIFEEELNKEIAITLIPIVKKALLKAYDELADQEEAQTPPDIKGKDPTSLKKWRHLFEKQLDSELKNVKIEDGTINLSFGDATSFGYGKEGVTREGPPETVDWLSYYIEGYAGEAAFISQEHYLKFRGSTRSTSSYGRFGEGFLMSKDTYIKEGWERPKHGVLKGKIIPFSSVRHSISGQAAYTGFTDAISALDLSSVVKNAIVQAIIRIKVEVE